MYQKMISKIQAKGMFENQSVVLPDGTEGFLYDTAEEFFAESAVRQVLDGPARDKETGEEYYRVLFTTEGGYQYSAFTLRGFMKIV